MLYYPDLRQDRPFSSLEGFQGRVEFKSSIASDSFNILPKYHERLMIKGCRFPPTEFMW